MDQHLSRRLLEKLQGRVDETQLKRIASGVKKEDLSDEDKLRQLVRTVAAVSGLTVSPEREDRLVELIRTQQINPNDLTSLSKLLK